MSQRSYNIYLAGPITGLSYDGCTDWRQYVQNHLPRSGTALIGMSPMRSKQYLLQETTLGDSYEETVLSSQRGIFARDFWDATRCDAILVNLLGTKKPDGRVSIGTVMEIAWAYGARVPIVLVMEKDGSNVHDHSMLREACPLWVETLEESIEVLKAMFLASNH